MYALLIFMTIDYLTGIVVAGVFKTSNKSQSGTLSSKAAFNGLCKKCTVLFWLYVAYVADAILRTSCVKDAICAGFFINELISVTENIGLMAESVPQAIYNAFEVIRNKKRSKGIMKFVMDAPPELTGDAQTDIKNLYNHIVKLQEEIEILIRRMSRSNE